ncbi:hypothetical protein NBO_28g0073 [Nosema bombycis CQ1]|uniref:Uncharacterized protein n=1 Tax=Nosema bombycis (strain CQ1 / CVCC 102059) TaxID=578461 RepID=R0M911_NOSB1|nr:hypothetical protein NBO_28g0073 [Nosema bombycis CQ1]|eukprot:EOB14434.1 hypothetical protein NBO_28g0073 [Nosema bombycis CQ1]
MGEVGREGGVKNIQRLPQHILFTFSDPLPRNPSFQHILFTFSNPPPFIHPLLHTYPPSTLT